MNRSWFHRMLLSYLPVFFLISTILILSTFILIGQLAKEEAVRANQLYVEYTMQRMDSSIREIDSSVIKEIETNEALRDFYQSTNLDYLSMLDVTKSLHDFTMFHELVHSVYLHRFSDDMVLSMNRYVTFEAFGDNEFAGQYRTTQVPFHLSSLRSYDEFGKQGDRVVSIVRQYPLLTGDQGTVVVNLSVHRLQRLLSEWSDSSLNYVVIQDAEGHVISTTDLHVEQAQLESESQSLYHSEFTGWSYIGGFVGQQVFSFASMFIYGWIGIAVLFILAGAVWMMYMTKRNYEPIQTILSRVQKYTKSKSILRAGKKSDEFYFIEQALDSLIEQTDTYQEIHEQDMMVRWRLFFLELKEGHRTINGDIWGKEMKSLGMPETFYPSFVAIYEVDQYYELFVKYTERDQHLLKFVLANVVKETAEPYKVHVWTEWTAKHQLTAFYQVTDESCNNDDFTATLVERVRLWIEENLNFTITVGLGPIIDQPETLHDAFAGAAESLDFKSTLGRNRVIRYQAAESNKNGEEYMSMQLIRPLAQSYRTGEGDWRKSFHDIFTGLRNAQTSREDIMQMMNYVIYHLYREMTQLPDEVQALWKDEVQPSLMEALESFELLDELESCFLEILSHAESKLRIQLEERTHHKLIQDVKNYILEHYANPDLSLDHLQDVFRLNGKYISRLFKEYYGERLIDFILRVKIECSKELLKDTSKSLQDVANAVGYIHVMSYIRAFKKLVGTTPGEFRKNAEQIS